MEFLTVLWLPIILSTVFVFIVSSVIHMVLPYHRSDVSKIPNEDGILDTMRAAKVGPGPYMFPCPDDMKDMKSPEMLEKYKKGPVGFLVVLPGSWNMGKSLTLWFIYSFIVSIFCGYLGYFALSSGAHYLEVFRITGTIAVLGYAFSNWHDFTWKGQPWSITWKFMFDGIIYGLVTAGTFGWLWPAA